MTVFPSGYVPSLRQAVFQSTFPIQDHTDWLHPEF